jgi:predicted ester cyclase
MTQDSKQLVRRFFEESARRRGLPEELLAPGFRVHAPGATLDAQTFGGHISDWYAAFSDTAVVIEDILAEGDRVAVRVVQRGTHTGSYMGVPPSGRQVATGNTVIARVADGRIAEWWPSFDALALMRQIGALPEAATSA